MKLYYNDLIPHLFLIVLFYFIEFILLFDFSKIIIFNLYSNE
jgi:hypothetical protein